MGIEIDYAELDKKLMEKLFKWMVTAIGRAICLGTHHIYRSHLEKQAISWPTMKANVYSNELKEVEQYKLFKLIIVYSYYVKEYWIGEYTEYFRDEKLADLQHAYFRTLEPIVNYNPENPAKSVLLREQPLPKESGKN